VFGACAHDDSFYMLRKRDAMSYFTLLITSDHHMKPFFVIVKKQIQKNIDIPGLEVQIFLISCYQNFPRQHSRKINKLKWGNSKDDLDNEVEKN
jgi:hypothetical protein